MGHLVRGLSALFWGLPLALLICVKTALSDLLKPYGMAPPILVTSLLLYGLMQFDSFQRQERVWRAALEKAKLFGIVNIGLAPFIFWWNKLPFSPYFTLGVLALGLSGILFLFHLNQALQRLSAMLPDETLRVETKFFSTLNLYLLAWIIGLAAVYVALQQFRGLPMFVIHFLRALEVTRLYLLVLLILVPVAMTMTMLWKIKEVILNSLFSHE